MRIALPLVVLLVAGCRSDRIDIATPTPVALHVNPAGGAFNVGEPLLFNAHMVAADSSDLGSATGVTWVSSDTVVATISRTGAFQARCIGSTTITATTTVDGRILKGARQVSVGTGDKPCAAFDRAPL